MVFNYKIMIYLNLRLIFIYQFFLFGLSIYWVIVLFFIALDFICKMRIEKFYFVRFQRLNEIVYKVFIYSRFFFVYSCYKD